MTCTSGEHIKVKGSILVECEHIGYTLFVWDSNCAIL